MLRLLSRALGLALLVALPLGVSADEDGLPERTLTFGVRDTNAARFAIGEVRRLLASDRTLQGLQVAQRVLEEMSTDLYLVHSRGASTRWRLAADEVRDLLAALTPEEREVYERIASPGAAPLLARARALRDPEALARVEDLYGASTSGVEAGRLLAAILLEQGRFLDAARAARDALRFAPADVALWRLAVEALARAGDRRALEGLAPPPGLLVDGPEGPRPVEAVRRDALARLPVETPGDDWPMWGRTPARDGVSPLTAPLPDPLRWRAAAALPERDLDSEPTRGFGPDNSDLFWAQWERYRPLDPAVADRVLYVSEGRSVQALDLYSGARIWSFDDTSASGLRLERPGGHGPGRTSLERAYAPVVAGDTVYATVEVRLPYEPEMLQQVEISTYLPRRVLVALDRATGALRWTMGTSEADREALEGTTLVSPCAVAEGLVFVVGSRYLGGHNVSMLAFDATTGALVWSRPLCWGQQELNLFGAPVKELAASAPAVLDGVVYASTGLGVVAAVETRTGRPVWLASYEIEEILPVEFWFKAPLRFPRVSPSPPVARGDLLLVAPTDGRHLCAFDRKDGSLRWRTPYRGTAYGATAHFLGVVNDGHRDVALLTGTDLEAYDLSDGRLAWLGRVQEDFGEENFPVGRGAVAGDQVLVPTVQGLARFSLSREGSFAGRDPWPPGAEAGNVLPLPQVLVVTARESVQGFWRWEEIEREIARRRRERPRDPWVLLEAAEIYRLGRAFERAEESLDEAMRLARAAGDERALHRAERGLYLTWGTVAATYAEAGRTEEARAALADALRHAQEPAERVDARIRMDALLEDAPEERVRNLERLVAEADGVRATFPGSTEGVPARAMARLRLARLRLDLGRQREAVDDLQRLIREDGDARLGDLTARQHARALIDEVVRVWGPAPYAAHEAEARRLLEDAAAAGDGARLERILSDYPNATVVPAALLALGERQIAAVMPGEAARILARLVAEYPDDVRAAKAAALLSRAYGQLGQQGAQRFAAAWVGDRHPASTFELDGREVTGARFAAEEPLPPRPGPPPPRAAAGPLEERLFERVAEDAWGRQIDVSAEPGRPSPLALLGDGTSVTAIDLPTARVAFRLSEGAVHRGLYLDGVLVLAGTGELRGVSPDTGRTLWLERVEGHVMMLEGARGQVYALLQDATGVTGDRSLLALDVARGRPIWQVDLEQADYRSMRAEGTNVLVRQARYERGWVWPAVVVLDGLTGHVRHVISLPAQGRMEREPEVAGGRVVVVGREADGTRTVAGHDVETGALAWSLPLPGTERTSALVADGSRVVVLQTDGRLTTFDAERGAVVSDTRIFVGEDATAYPYHGTDPLVGDGRLVLMPLVRTSGRTTTYVLGAWALDSGKLLWDARWETEERLTRAILARSGSRVLALASYNRTGAPARVLLQVVDAATGERLQDIEPMGLLAEHGLLALAEGWGTVVVFGRGGAGVYAPKAD